MWFIVVNVFVVSFFIFLLLSHTHCSSPRVKWPFPFTDPFTFNHLYNHFSTHHYPRYLYQSLFRIKSASHFMRTHLNMHDTHIPTLWYHIPIFDDPHYAIVHIHSSDHIFVDFAERGPQSRTQRKILPRFPNTPQNSRPKLRQLSTKCQSKGNFSLYLSNFLSYQITCSLLTFDVWFVENWTTPRHTSFHRCR